MVAATVRNSLLAAGHDVAVAIGGEAGFSQFTRMTFDLVICDLFMPEKDGIETIRAFRACAADVPIIAMSGGGFMSGGNLGASELLRMAEALGAARTIQKPFRGSQLVAIVQELLQA